jgi:hypothetical protein
MTIKNLLPLLAIAAVLSGCKSGDTAAAAPADNTATPAVAKAEAKQGDLTGIWDSNAGDKTGDPAVFEFKSDGTYVMSAEGPTPDGKGKIKSVADGTYKSDAKSVSLQMTGMKLSADDPAIQKELDKQNGPMAEVLKQMKPIVHTLDWKDKDNVVMSESAPANGKPQVYTLKRKA